MAATTISDPPKFQEKSDSLPDDVVLGSETDLINASGHPDQLERNYGILSICGMALTVDNAWVAIGTTLNVAICRFTSFEPCSSSVRASEIETGADFLFRR